MKKIARDSPKEENNRRTSLRGLATVNATALLRMFQHAEARPLRFSSAGPFFVHLFRLFIQYGDGTEESEAHYDPRRCRNEEWGTRFLPPATLILTRFSGWSGLRLNSVFPLFLLLRSSSKYGGEDQQLGIKVQKTSWTTMFGSKKCLSSSTIRFLHLSFFTFFKMFESFSSFRRFDFNDFLWGYS